MIFTLPDLLKQNLFELEGKDFVMTIKKKHEAFTVNQMAYYRSAVLMTCYSADMFMHFDNKDEIHEHYFAPMFLSYVKVVNIPGQKPYEDKSKRSLADLSKEEMSNFLERVLAHCAELDIQVPPPELAYSKYYQK